MVLRANGRRVGQGDPHRVRTLNRRTGPSSPPLPPPAICHVTFPFLSLTGGVRFPTPESGLSETLGFGHCHVAEGTVCRSQALAS